MRVLLVRNDTQLNGTDGTLTLPSGRKLKTLELPWRDNLPEQSCIPYGIYQCKKIFSPKFGDTFEVMDVPNRTHILFHKGNSLTDTQGCILIGSSHIKDSKGDDRLINSKIAFGIFLSEMQCDEFELEVR